MRLFKCSFPNCPISRKVLLNDGTIENRRETMTEDEYLGHLTGFHRYNFMDANRIIASDANNTADARG